MERMIVYRKDGWIIGLAGMHGTLVVIENAAWRYWPEYNGKRWNYGDKDYDVKIPGHVKTALNKIMKKNPELVGR